MKIKYILAYCIFLIASSIEINAEKPDFNWEQHYAFPDVSISPFMTMNYSENGILLWLEGSDTNVKTFSVIKSDKNGNILIQKDYRRPDTIGASLKSAKIFNKNNSFEIYGLYAHTVDMIGPYLPLKKFKIDNECNVTGNISDLENNETLISFVNPNYLYDSVYIGIRDWYYLSDSINVEYLQSLLVYDSDCKFIRKLILDTAGINDSLNLRFAQERIFTCNEGNIIASFQAKLQDTSVFGKTNYIYFCKYNLSGEMIWKCKLDISQNGFTGMSVQTIFQREDGSYNFFGRLFRGDFNKSEFAGIMGQISESGELQWSKIINYESLDIYTGAELKVIAKGDYFVFHGYGLTGLEKRHYWLMIVDKDGNKLDEYKWNNEIDDNTISISDLQVTETGNLIMVGLDGWHSVYLAEIKPKLINSVYDENSKLNWLNISISPNPGTDNIQIKFNDDNINYEAECNIVNLNGEIISKFEMQGEYNFSLKDLTTGTYYLNLKISDENNKHLGSITKKFVKM